MTAANILIYVALIGYILYRRIQGRPVKAGGRLFVLPVVLVVIGFGDVSQGANIKPIEVTLIVIAGAISMGLGLLRGRADKLTERDGSPFVQWGSASVILFVGNLAAKLVLDVIGLAAGSTSSAVGKSLLLTFGLTLLGEAIVLRMRTGGATGSLTPRVATAGPPRQPRAERLAASRTAPASGGTSGEPIPEPAQSPGDAPGRQSAGASDGSLIEALARHHERHRERHQERHRRRGRNRF